MVWFQCEDCGENLKKPKHPNHFRMCSAYKLSCIDCGLTFNRVSVQTHTQCISEANFSNDGNKKIAGSKLMLHPAGKAKVDKESNERHHLLSDEESSRLGIYDKPLPCFGCGIGWFSFRAGFVCPLLWYYATILYFGNYYRKDPRERGGLAASAIAALVCTVAVCITMLVILL